MQIKPTAPQHVTPPSTQPGHIGLVQWLTYAGTIPFILCAGLLMLNIQTIPWLGQTQHVLSVYALLIASFMSGSHWGHNMVLHPSGKCLPLLSNILAIACGFAFLLLPFVAFTLSMVLVLLCQLWIDFKLHQQQKITIEYWTIRWRVTTMVCSGLCVATGAVWLSTARGL